MLFIIKYLKLKNKLKIIENNFINGFEISIGTTEKDRDIYRDIRTG